MIEETLQAEPTGYSYFLSRLTARQAHYLWDCSSSVNDDVKFYDAFLSGLEERGEYLNLAQLYLTLKSLYGESDEDPGDGKSTFSFQFLLAIHKADQVSPFLLHVFDYRGAPRFQFRKLARPAAGQSAPSEVTRAELNTFIEIYYRRLIRQFQAIRNQPHEIFFRRVKEPPILYGYRNGEYFEQSFASENQLFNHLLRGDQTMEKNIGIETKAMPINIGIEEKDREEIAQGLSRLLADTYTLYLKTHNFHWNVTGPMFQTLHLMFEQQYNELALAVDLIAERIRALGFFAPGSYRDFSRLSAIKEEEGVPDAREMIRLLVEGQEAVIRTARSIFPIVERVNDQPTADLLTQRMQVHEKTAWMLRSLLAEEQQPRAFALNQ